MPSVKLDTGSLPKSSAGRKAIEPDSDLVEALTKHFGNGILDENGRPIFAGPMTEYDSEGKATSAGRRHAKPVSENIGKTFRVNVIQLGDDGPYRWRLYVPAATAKDSEAEAEAS
jgi:hypothetical protein